MNNAIPSPRMFVLVLILAAVGTVFFLASWGTLDYFLVRSPRYPAGVHDYDWLLLCSPLLVFALDYLIAIRLRARRRWAVCALATLCAIPLAILLIVRFGVPLHWWLGGQL